MKSRGYKDGDHSRIMNFLREIYKINKNQHCWLPQRWEYAEYLVNPLYIERGHSSWEKFIRIWEEAGGIVGIAHKEDTCNAYLQIRPGYRNIEKKMVKWVEANIYEITETETGDKRKTVIWLNESDSYRKNLLADIGFEKGDTGNYLNIQKLDKEYRPDLSEGYSFLSMDQGLDLLKRYKVIYKSFHPESDELQEVPGHFLKMIKAPMYRPDLDIVVADIDGSFASSCIIWYDEELNIGMFEPVGTHPDYLRKGLGRAVLIEGLRRLKEMGAERAFVEAYGDKKYDFYKSVGFESYDIDYPFTIIK